MTTIRLTAAEAMRLNDIDSTRVAYAESFRDPLFHGHRAAIRRAALSLKRYRGALIRQWATGREDAGELVVTTGQITHLGRQP
jgi:hypothetical protein